MLFKPFIWWRKQIKRFISLWNICVIDKKIINFKYFNEYYYSYDYFITGNDTTTLSNNKELYCTI